MYREKIWTTVLRQTKLTDDVFDLWLKAERAAEEAAPGQFVSLFTADAAHLLPRPISICQIDRKEGSLRLVYRVAGFGTKEFSGLKEGDKIAVIGPLGNGFPLEKLAGIPAGRVLAVGGGIGIPPMLALAQALPGRTSAVLGYRSSDTFLADEFQKTCSDTIIATDDGSLGIHGTVVDAIRAKDLKADVICACGPMPMLKAVKAFAAEKGIPCYLSLEERMACGIGACLACVCKTRDKDLHTNVNNARICREGPVFAAETVEL